MNYIHSINNEIIKYPYDRNNLEKDNPSVCFAKIIPDEISSKYNRLPVEPVTPSYDISSQAVTEGLPELIEGVWKETWIIRDLTEEEIVILEKLSNPVPETVKGADLRAVLKTFKIVDNSLISISSSEDISLYTQIVSALNEGITQNVIAMIGILEQFQTLGSFNRHSKGITDMIAYLPFLTNDIADELFRKTKTFN